MREESCSSSSKTRLKQIERKLLWLACWTIHNANHLREKSPDGLKVGGHQASCASMASIMTALYFTSLRPQDRVAVKPHASPIFHAMQYLMGNQTREKLRIICWVHDTFKHIEDKSSPRDWTKHHAVYARKFLERYTDDQLLLNVVEMHDDAYYAWRLAHLYHKLAQSDERIKMVRERVGDYWQLFYLFFKCDTSTGDKNPAPLTWFEDTMEDIEVVEFTGEEVEE